MTLKLSYFDMEGFAEPIRLALTLAGVEFIDNRVSFADWPEFSKTTPNGSVPILEVDGKVFTQNYAIMRYICFKYGLMPETIEDIYTCDEIYETVFDTRKIMVHMLMTSTNPAKLGMGDCTADEVAKRSGKMLKMYSEDHIPVHLKRLNEICVNTGFLYDGKKMTGADILVYTHVKLIMGDWSPIPSDLCNKHKNLLAMKEKFECMPAVRKHFGMSAIRLTYFPIEGLAEPIRLCLKMAGVDFEDRRLSFEEFATIKHTFPNGQLPVLEVDGRVMPQFKAMLRFCGRKYDLSPKNIEESFLCDEVVETVDDMIGTYVNTIYLGMKPEMFGWENSTDEGRKAVIKKMREASLADSLPKSLVRLDELVAKSGMCNGDKVTIGDIFAYAALRRFRAGYLDHIPTDVYVKNENLTNLMRKMEEIPEIKAHYKL